MCERLSWIELPDKTLLYLTTYDLWDTSQGERVRKQFSPDDWWGHAAIKFFYEKELRGKYGQERECTDYSKPENFPPEIAQAIKEGKFRDIADPVMLTPAARKKCAAYDKAWAAYDKARAAYDKARAACDKAWAAYDKARAAYDKARAASSDPFPKFWKFFTTQGNRAQAWRDKKAPQKGTKR